MEQLVRHYKESYLGGRLPAYDGRKSLYTAGPLPFTSREFQITLIDEDDGSGTERSFVWSTIISFEDIYISNFMVWLTK